MTRYDETPEYYWYIAKKRIEGEYRAFWVNGSQFIGFTEEPSYEMIERYDLREKGYGNITTIGR